MKKIVLIVAMAVMVASIAITPALAQGFDQDIDESGDVNQSSDITNTGDNSNQCAAPQQVGNTGSLQNAQGFSNQPAGDQGLDEGVLKDLLKDNDLTNHQINNLIDAFGQDNGASLGDVSFEGPEMTFNPQQNVECNQVVDQKSYATSY